MTNARTSQQWWEEVKACPQKIEDWLKRQYVGEIAAVNLLSEVLVKYGYDTTHAQWRDIHKIMQQEALHGLWIKELMDARGIKPEPNADLDRRYWAEVLPHVNSFAEAAAAAFHAEHMRLDRIRAIAHDTNMPSELQDVQDAFLRILPHEEWHEQAFNDMRQGQAMTQYHEKGLEALNLILA